MKKIDYLELDWVNPEELAHLLNKARVRKHLADHPAFDAASIGEWLGHKRAIDVLPGCRIRAVSIGGRLAGWCGIQPLDEQHEIALVLDDAHWGRGGEIFRQLLGWAREFGHASVSLYLPLSRREYGFLRRQSRRTSLRAWRGEQFRVYELALERDGSFTAESHHAQH
ncbi:hypothetical protein [Thiobacillus sp.]|uniref:GNAT family N-acetyltransferase n=1 Tax=Thiobacillus sp. TaxID=924 RepID=UPI0017976D9E|nr:hypothetical protein [Thiobacillus sp.]MBC2732495.1 N-acetyltransferase [Thiobacillus sp.]MBC2741234.1 N-acetyltransferase [Thiobacillus sp.]MBC2761404.1 N-acetyltransferase [Thiobacillus sp.]